MTHRDRIKSRFIYYLLWGLIVALFFPTFRHLYSYRWDVLGYTHAYFILPVSLGLAFWKRRELAAAFASTEKKFGTLSFSIFIFGGLMYLFGWLQGYTIISTFALFLGILGG